MLKYLAKISMDIFPSVLATIIGAYIVNHYINAKPAADTPTAVVAPAEAGKNGKPADVANLPAPGVKAKGVSEKSVSEKTATDKAAAEKPADKPETKAADVAPADTTSHGRPPAREKAAAKSISATTGPGGGGQFCAGRGVPGCGPRRQRSGACRHRASSQVA
ncbi:membrane protein involved in colicin uptake [Bradyrhizobium diazoefficiens]